MFAVSRGERIDYLNADPQSEKEDTTRPPLDKPSAFAIGHVCFLRAMN
jgi:hypothetical protein